MGYRHRYVYVVHFFALAIVVPISLTKVWLVTMVIVNYTAEQKNIMLADSLGECNIYIAVCAGIFGKHVMADIIDIYQSVLGG